MKFKEIREKYKSKFPTSLVAAAVKIALDMGGNMTGAYKKIEAMKRGLGDDPAVKDALRLANENVNEGLKELVKVSCAVDPKNSAKFEALLKKEIFGYNGPMDKSRYEKLGLDEFIIVGPSTPVMKWVGKYKSMIIKLAKLPMPKITFESAERNAEGILEFATSMTYFNMKGATKAEKIAKGIGIYKSTEKKGKAPNFAYTVHVDGDFEQVEKWSRLI